MKSRKLLVLTLGAVLMLFATPVVLGQTYNVTTASGVLAVDDLDGQCSFYEALFNVVSGVQNSMNCPAPNGLPDVITFNPGLTITLAAVGTMPTVSEDVEILGPVTIDGSNYNSILLDVLASDVVLNLVTIQENGASAVRASGATNLTVIASVFDNNGGTGTAGGINAGCNGAVRISASAFTRNSTTGNGGAISKGTTCDLFVSASTFGGPLLGNSADRGGAIYIGGVDAAGAVVLTGNAFLDNSSTGTGSGDGGGAIYVFGASSGSVISIVGGVFGDPLTGLSGNTAANRGGAIYNQATEGLVSTGPIDSGVIGVEFVGNSADGPAGADGLGGAIYNQGSMSVFHSTFEGNTSNNSGGGAIGDNQMVSSRELNVVNSTFNGNVAATDGGAISLFNGNGNATLRNVTLSGNVASNFGPEIFADGDIDLGNTIIQNAGVSCAGGGTFTDTAGNLRFDGDAGTSCGIALGGDPLLAGLTLNLGPVPVRTMELMPLSAALDSGDSGICSSFPVVMLDARGIPRPSTCDTGAFEGGDTARVVINEVDYDDAMGADDHEFIELYNAGTASINLDNFRIDLVDGSGGGATLYSVPPAIDLPSVTLSPGEFFVVCGQQGSGVPLINCDLDLMTDDFLLDSTPAAVGLRLSGVLLDALSYGGDTGAPYTEGTGAGPDDLSEDFFGLSRVVDGADSDDNSTDFAGRCATPKEPNSSSTGPMCLMVPVELMGFSVD